MLNDWFFRLNELKHKGLIKGRMKGYDMKVPYMDILDHTREEYEEFIDAIESGKLREALKELADLSNMCDLFFEQIYEAVHNKAVLL